jgi:ribosomal protein S18 acetylase RimI-like enzyme
MLVPLAPRHAEAAWTHLTAHGLRDVFLASKIHEGALAAPDGAAQGRFLGAFDGPRLAGVLFVGHGGLVVFSADEPHVRRLIAEESWRERQRVRLLVGEWEAVSDVWGQLSAAGLRADRDWREVFMVVDASTLAREPDPGLVGATRADLPDLVDVSARAYREETGEDPLAAMGEGYVRHVTRNVEEERTFLVREKGRIVFKAELSARCPIGAQIVGVFTEPFARGRGLARRGTAQLARTLLARHGMPAVCLFVRKDNAPARRAYERASFLPRMHYRRLFVDPASTRGKPATKPSAGPRGAVSRKPGVPSAPGSSASRS